MAVMFLGRLIPRHLRAAATRRPGAERWKKRPRRGTYHDSFFADPVVVEDDSRRMRVRYDEKTESAKLVRI